MGQWQTPQELGYTRSDEWLQREDGEALVGITDYAQDQLNDIVFLELPQVGERFAQGEAFGVVESVKAASDLHMPLGGEVVAVNNTLEDEPELVNGDAYSAWMIRLRPDDPATAGGLLDAAAYAAWCAERQGA